MIVSQGFPGYPIDGVAWGGRFSNGLPLSKPAATPWRHPLVGPAATLYAGAEGAGEKLALF